LTERGIAPQNIHDSGLCTRCDGSIFHSYRRDAGRGGRNLAVAAH
jgi:copper oxidase (laccase) domain-containing protein